MKNQSQNRRDFLKTSLAGMAAAAALPYAHPAMERKKPEMEGPVRRKLGKTGIRLPVVSMGTGDTQDPALVKAALDAGVVLLATSSYYAKGENERMIGRVIKGRKRDSFAVMTSVMPDGIDFKAGLFTEASKPGPFLEKFEGSLKRLELEYVDIFLLPFAARRESVLYEPLLKAMEAVKKQGKARFIGIATHQYEAEALRAAVETKIYDVVMTAYNFRKDNRDEIGAAAGFAADAGMGIIAMKTMAGAYWDKEKTRPINAGAALKWVLQNKNIHTAVPGMTTFEQLACDMAVMKDPSLSDGEKADLETAAFRAPDGPFCQQCGRCIPQCRHRLDIPTFMRSHMYAFGHGNAGHARDSLALAGCVDSVSDLPCGRCVSCPVRCPMRFDVKRKMADMAGLFKGKARASEILKFIE
jgi:predicted aldo/keto reductase-like oxidoreductase